MLTELVAIAILLSPPAAVEPIVPPVASAESKLDHAEYLDRRAVRKLTGDDMVTIEPPVTGSRVRPERSMASKFMAPNPVQTDMLGDLEARGIAVTPRSVADRVAESTTRTPDLSRFTASVRQVDTERGRSDEGTFELRPSRFPALGSDFRSPTGASILSLSAESFRDATAPRSTFETSPIRSFRQPDGSYSARPRFDTPARPVGYQSMGDRLSRDR